MYNLEAQADVHIDRWQVMQAGSSQ